MDSQKLCEILSRLTNAQVEADHTITLSSVQQGALAALARRAGMELDRNLIKKPFTPAALSSRAIASSPEPSLPSTGQALVPATTSVPGGRIGCDVQSISEFGSSVQHEDYKSCPFLTAHLSAEEISRCENQHDALQSLCGIFAAKEAIRKTGDRRKLGEIVVTHDAEGAPRSAGYSISISHSGGICFAVALSG